MSRGRRRRTAFTRRSGPVVQRLVQIHPQLGHRVKRLKEDQVYLSALVGEQMGISYRDSAHLGRLMDDSDKWK